MSPPKAQLIRLSAQNFRGVGHRLDLNLAPSPQDRPGWVLLVGENGTGKSSFVDALDYLVHGELAHLKRQDVKEPLSLCFYADSETALETEIRTFWQVPGDNEPLEWSVGYPYPEELSVPDGLQDTVWQCRARPFILRRAQILNFVNAKRAERRRTIVELLGLDEWESIEKAWAQVKNDARKIAKEAKTQVKDFSKRLTEQQRKAQGVLEVLEGGGVSLPLVEASLQEPAKAQLQESIERLRQRKSQAQQALEQQVAALETKLQSLGELHGQVNDLLAILQEWLPEVRTFQQEAQAEGQALLLRLLESGAQFLEEIQPSVCPLCGQPIESADVLQHVRQRHATLSSLKQRRERLGQRKNAIVRRIARAQQTCHATADKVSGESAEILSGLNATLNALNDLLQVEPFRVSVDEVGPLLDALQSKLVDLQTQQRKIEQRLHEAREQLGNAPHSEQLLQAIAALEELVSLQDKLAMAQRKQSHWQARAELAEKVLKAFQESRQAFLEELFDQMETRFNEYWETMHPGEGVRFRLKTFAKGVRLDSEMQMGEIAKEGHPLTFLSEGHLDTLGLAIFLAFTQEFNRELPLLVLDDVLTTVDHGHRQRIASLLTEKFADWHLILTTHDRLWGEQLRAAARAYDIPVRLYRMRPWDPITGASVEEWIAEPWEYYRQVAEKMPALAIAGAGRELEKFLNIMRRTLRVAVPANPVDQYTIGELWEPFRSWVKKHWPKEIPEKWAEVVPNNGDLLDELQEIERLWRMRNWSGAHYNEWADNVTTAEAKEFIATVERLVNLFRCPYQHEDGRRCLAFLQYDPNTKVIACSKKGAEHFGLQAKK